MASSPSTAAPLVQTPIQVSTYTRPRSKQVDDVCSSHSNNIHRSHVAVGDVVRLGTHGLRRRRGLVVTLEQGVAIVLMDLQTQTPVHTYTLKPSEHACTPPLVIERSVPGPHHRQLLRTTYVGLLDAGRAASPTTRLTAYTEALDKPGKHVPSIATTTSTFDVPGHLVHLYPLLSGALLAARNDGSVVLLSDPMDEHRPCSVLDTYAADPIYHDVRVLDGPAAHSLFAHHATSNDDGATVQGAWIGVTSHPNARMLRLHVVGVYPTAPYFRAVANDVPSIDARHLVSCALDGHGILAALTRTGLLYTTTFAMDGDTLQIEAPHTVSLALQHACLVFLSTTHLLLIALQSDGGKVRAAALVWDTDLDAVLASVEWALSTTEATQVHAARVLDDHVLIQMDTSEGSRGGKGTLAALPVTVPARGLLRHALQAATRTQPWLVAKDDIEATDAAASTTSPTTSSWLAALSALPTEPGARATALDEQFQAWLHKESEHLRSVEHVKASRKAPKVPLDAALVTHVLDYALPPLAKPGTPSSAPVPYARDTVRYLLERGVVTASLLPDLVPRAQRTRDWSVLFLLLRHVPDRSEAHAVALLAEALATRDAPQAPAVARVLQHVLLPPTLAKPALRMALRTHIKNDDDVLILLDILQTWLELHIYAPLEGKARRTTEGTRAVPHTELTYRVGDVQPPRLEACVSFAEDLLDTYFPQWIAAAPRTHMFLRDFMRGLTQAVQAMQTLSRLRAPLHTVAHARERDEKDGRSKRLELHEASLLVPTYSVESLEV
ncbi:RNA binding protein [Malassezia pachydermatis]|uniref:Uncharacterized protein n=1 Tax=Malassezia pachydermatis TaxID=77020 RepID=A0A0M9VMY8_9BASI|nr:hypothetical protein Malapachy_1383 [Malassezia pachydermatis]KOS12785.1 hypothetical protein Malapachy_1383 [Malassezia pachydermatis]